MSWRWRLALSSPRLRGALRSELLAELSRPAELGEPWPESIAEAATSHPSATVRSALAEIAPRLAEGDSLSLSLRGLENFVGAEARAVLRTAEESGRVDSALAELEASSVQAEDSAARLRKTWIAPLITILIAILAYGILATATIPVFMTLLGEKVPWVMSLAPVWTMNPKTWVVVWFVLAALFVLVLRQLSWIPGGERVSDALPFWGALRRSARGVHAARSLSRLLGAGVPLDASLEATAEVLPDGEARREMRGAAHLLRDGASAREVFEAPSGSLPPVLRAVLAAADGDDGLADGLSRLARFEEAELERHAARAELASGLAAVLLAGLLTAYVSILGWSAYFDSLDAMPF